MGYIVRELLRRRRQAIAVAAGLAVAVAVVVVIGGVGAGLRSAQSRAIGSLYGVGTDLTVSHPAAPGSGAPQFTFGSGSGSTANGTTSIALSKLVAAKGAGTGPAGEVATVARTRGVVDIAPVLLLDNYDFSGLIPSLTGASPPPDAGGDAGAGTGADSHGGSNFTVDSFRVAGVELGHTTGASLLASTRITAGRGLSRADAGQRVVVVDRAYAVENQIAVGSTLNIAGVDIPVVGLIASSDTGAATSANAYLPLDTAQELSGLGGQITHVFVKAASASQVPAIGAALKKALPGSVVATQADLASTVTGSLASVTGLAQNLGTWLSIIAVAAAALLAALLTLLGVARRTREFGTLKAIGWRSGQIIAQVTGESFVQGVVGAVLGVGVGALAIAVLDAFSPRLTANLSATGTTTQVPLVPSFPAETAMLAAALAVLASLLAAAAAALRVSLLRPSEALRSAE